MILSIDPGLNACGCALFGTAITNELLWAGLIKNKIDASPLNPTYHSMIWRGMVDAVDERIYRMFGGSDDHKPHILAIELPQIYVASRSKGDANDLITLTGVVGALTQWFHGTTFMYHPHSWKGTVPKKIMSNRILKRLSEVERSKIEKSPESLIHNVYDGIGVGLHHIKRL